MEEYLEVIYDIQNREKRAVRTKDIAKILNVKPSSVTEMLIKLYKKGYIDYKPYYGAKLTKKGEEIAKRIKKYYTVFYTFFKNYLGIDDETASRLSCELEHHLNDNVIVRICGIVAGECDICDECSYRIKKLSEVGEGIYRVIAAPVKFKEIGLTPGKVIRVCKDGVEIDGTVYDIDIDFAEKILVI